MDSPIIIGIIMSIIFIFQGCINIRFNHYVVTLQDRVDTLEQLHWARTNPVHIEVVPIEDPECANPSNI